MEKMSSAIMKRKIKSIIWRSIWCVIREWKSINLYEWEIISEDWDYVKCSVIDKSDINEVRIEKVFHKNCIKFTK